MNNKHLPKTEEQKKMVIDLYKEGHSYADIRDITGFSFSTISPLVKGIRTFKDSLKIARARGKYVFTEEGKNKISQNAIRSIKNRKNKYWTKPEREFYSILKSLGIKVRIPDYFKDIIDAYKDNDESAEILYQYPIQRYTCDFVDIVKKIVYRINGDFWHANPILYPDDKLTKIQIHNRKQDTNCKVYLETNGWQVVDIWESETYWNVDRVKEIIWATRKMANPSALQAEDSEFESPVAYLDDWSEKLKSLWIKKPKEKKQFTAKKCQICNKDFLIPSRNKRDNNNRKFCGKNCLNLSRRVQERPTLEQLEKDVKELGWLGTGNKYKVSDNTIRKWVKLYRRI